MANHENRNARLQIGTRVSCGQVGTDEYDEGVVCAHITPPRGDCDVIVAWDSGVRTAAVGADLIVEG